MLITIILEKVIIKLKLNEILDQSNSYEINKDKELDNSGNNSYNDNINNQSNNSNNKSNENIGNLSQNNNYNKNQEYYDNSFNKKNRISIVRDGMNIILNLRRVHKISLK